MWESVSSTAFTLDLKESCRCLVGTNAVILPWTKWNVFNILVQWLHSTSQTSWDELSDCLFCIHTEIVWGVHCSSRDIRCAVSQVWWSALRPTWQVCLIKRPACVWFTGVRTVWEEGCNVTEQCHPAQVTCTLYTATVSYILELWLKFHCGLDSHWPVLWWMYSVTRGTA